MKAPVQFETDRLTLVAPTAADAEVIFERYAGDPEVTKYLGWPRHRSVADTREFLAFSVAEWERWGAGPYLIRERSDGRLLGGTGLGFTRPDEAVTGYVLARPREVRIRAFRRRRHAGGVSEPGAGRAPGSTVLRTRSRDVTSGVAMIRKLSDGRYRLYSRKKNPKTGRRRNLGTFKTRAAAMKHERAVQFFKRGG